MSNYRRQSETVTKSFTSWKLTVLNAIMCDARLNSGDKEFAFHIVHHLNAYSKVAWPSLVTVAARMNTSLSTAKRRAKKLEEAGWITRSRKNLRGPNHYEFIDAKVAEVMGLTKRRIDKAKENEKRRQKQNYERSQMSSQKVRSEGSYETL